MPDVHVPQRDGQIVITTGAGSTARTVKDHVVTVAAADLEDFLARVDGARVVEAKPDK